MAQIHNSAPCLDLLCRLAGLYKLGEVAAVRMQTDPPEYIFTEFHEDNKYKGMLSFFLPAKGELTFLSNAIPKQIFEGQDPEPIFAYLADHFPENWETYVARLRRNLEYSQFAQKYEGDEPLGAAVRRESIPNFNRPNSRVNKLNSYYKEHKTVGAFLMRHNFFPRDQLELTDSTKKSRQRNDEIEAIIALVLIWLAVYPCGAGDTPGAEQLRFSKQTMNKVAEIFSVSLPPERPDNKPENFLTNLLYSHPELRSRELQKEYSMLDLPQVQLDKIYMPVLPDFDLMKIWSIDNSKR